jgi:hypothetical protein
MTDRFDVAVVGAGAAGMMCAAVAGQRGRSVVLLDHAAKLAEKIRISGGGRCNFTNRDVGPANFLSDDPTFARTALGAYRPRDFIALVERHRVRWHEKHRGQLFCDDSSERIIDLLVAECEAGGVAWRRPVRVAEIAREVRGFRIDVEGGPIHAGRVVIATGGLSIPKLGATDFAYRVAKRFGLAVVEPRPGLVPLTFDAWTGYADLAGIALPARIACARGPAFDEDLLFTHRGLSGPGVLQISSYWRPGEPLRIDLAPELDLAAALREAKSGTRQNLTTVLASFVPRRVAARWQAEAGIEDRRIAEVRDATLAGLAASLERWEVRPDGTEGFRKAEVTAGGVATAELDPATLEARRVPGLHLIGEAVDVTGWLGGYNFQWAWASGAAAGRAV